MFKDSPEGQTQYEPAVPDLSGIDPVAEIVIDNTGLYLLKGAPDNLPRGSKLYSAATVERLVQERDQWKRIAESKYGQRGAKHEDLAAMTQERDRLLRQYKQATGREPYVPDIDIDDGC